MNAQASILLDNRATLASGIWPRSFTFWVVVLWCALFIIRPWEWLIPELQQVRFERAYAVGAILLLVASGKVRLLLPSFQSRAVLFFLSSLALSSVFAFREDLAYSVLYVYFTLAVFYFALISILRSAYELWIMIAVYVVTMTLYLSKALNEYFFHHAGETRMGVPRLQGIEATFGHPNALAGSIVYSMPFWLLLWQTRHEFTRPWPTMWKRLFALVLVVYLVLALGSVILTYSRSGMLGMLLFGLLSVMTMRSGQRRVVGLTVASLILVTTFALMPEDAKQRFESIWNPEAGQKGAQSAAEGRIAGLKAGIAMFKNKPILGVGLGCFVPYRARFIDGQTIESHNALAQVLGETGIVGFLSYCILVVGILLNCRQMKRLTARSRDPGMRPFPLLSTACTITVVLLVFMGLFGHNLLRFNYLWIAAFALIGRKVLESRLLGESEDTIGQRHRYSELWHRHSIP